MVTQFINQSEWRTERTWPNVSNEVSKHLGTRLNPILTRSQGIPALRAGYMYSFRVLIGLLRCRSPL